MPNSKPNIGIIILAAGSSSRMGKSKQLLLISNEPLLLKSVHEALHSEANQIVVVLGADADLHQKIIADLPLQITINRDWENGMGNSLKKGIHILLQSDKKFDAVITMVCDQPLITSHHLNNLIQKFNTTKNSIVASLYAGTFGVPVLFGQMHFEELLNIKDDQGAKKVIEQHKSEVVSVDFPEGTIDLDTPDEYLLFINTNH